MINPNEPSTDDAPILLRRSGSVAWLTFNRPHVANAIDAPLAAAFRETIAELNQDRDVRALVLCGAGKAFCAGGDLKRFAQEADGAPHYIERLIHDFHIGLETLADFHAPVVAAVNGAAAGAGLGLALSADIVIAGEGSRFVMAYTRAGLTPDGGTSWILPHLVGLRRALELTLMNRPLSASEAMDFGMISEVVPDADVEQRAGSIADSFATGPTAAFATARRLLRQALRSDYACHLKAEAESIVGSFRTDDGQEGVRAFRDRRAPVFNGE